MAGHPHTYETTLVWTGNTGAGTASYRSYERAHELSAPGKPTIHGSSDSVFRGDPQRWNPEDLLVASLSACHLLVFLHRAAVAGVTVVDYTDSATGTMLETADGGGAFTEVVLRPRVTVETDDMVAACDELHRQAHAGCFIARSVSFPVRHEATATALGAGRAAASARSPGLLPAGPA